MSKLKRFIKYLQWQKKEVLSNNSIEEVYDYLAENDIYDYTIDFEDRKNQLLRIFRKEDFNSKNVLDLACGTGVSPCIALDSKASKVTAIDLSSQMLSLAKQRLSQHSNIDFHNQSMMKLKELNLEEKFDVVVICNACRFITYQQEKAFFDSVKELMSGDAKLLILSDYSIAIRPLGRILEKIITLTLDKKKVNPNTTFEEPLRKQLQAHFSIDEIRAYGQENFFCGHSLFVCSKTT